MSEFDEPKFRKILGTFPSLMAQARAGQAAAFGRDAAVERVIAGLDGGQTVVLYGESGVGKTAIWHEVARRLSVRPVRDKSPRTVLHLTSVALLQQGCIYAGWWEQKLHDLAGEIAVLERTGRRTILVVADFGNLFRVSRSSKNDDKVIADDILQYVEAGTLAVAGEVTPALYRPGLAEDPRWIDRIRMVDVPPLAGDDLTRVLRRVAAARAPEVVPEGNARTLAAWRGGGAGTPDAEAILTRAVHLTERFMPLRAQPGAAIRLLEGAAELGIPGEPGVETAAARTTGVPLALISDTIPLSQAAIVARLGERVIGQPLAVTGMADTIAVIKAGLTDPRRPLGVHLFTGPSGTGKTELAKATAALLFGDEAAIVRLDMSEYFGGGSAERFSAALVARLADRPMSVVLLDEVEKADLGALDILLQVLSDGRVSAAGRHTSLRQSLIILTANVGFGPFAPLAADVVGNPVDGAASGIGFITARRAPALPALSPEAAGEPAVAEALAARFRPELIGRIDQIIVFRPLTRDAVRAIVKRELDRALAQEGFARRNLLLDYDEKLVDLLAAHGVDPRYGARPLVQAVKRVVVVPLARWLAAEPQARDQLLWLSTAHGALAVRCESCADDRGAPARE